LTSERPKKQVENQVRFYHLRTGRKTGARVQNNGRNNAPSGSSSWELGKCNTVPEREHVSREIEHGFFVHLDPKTKRVVGFAIHHLTEAYAEGPKPIPLVSNFKLKGPVPAQ